METEKYINVWREIGNNSNLIQEAKQIVISLGIKKRDRANRNLNREGEERANRNPKQHINGGKLLD